MVTTVVDKKTREILLKCHYACAAYNVRLLCSEEDMAEGGRDSSGPHGIFPPSKRTKSEVWVYSGYYKNAQERQTANIYPASNIRNYWLFVE